MPAPGFLFLVLIFMIGFSTTTLDIPHCTSANLTPVADPRLITGHFATALCTVESLTSGLNFETNKGIQFKSLPGPGLTPAHRDSDPHSSLVSPVYLYLSLDTRSLSER